MNELKLKKILSMLGKIFKRDVSILKIEFSQYNKGEMEITFHVRPVTQKRKTMTHNVRSKNEIAERTIINIYQILSGTIFHFTFLLLLAEVVLHITNVKYES